LLGNKGKNGKVSIFKTAKRKDPVSLQKQEEERDFLSAPYRFIRI